MSDHLSLNDTMRPRYYSVIDFDCLNLMLDQPFSEGGRPGARVRSRHLGQYCARLRREWMSRVVVEMVRSEG